MTKNTRVNSRKSFIDGHVVYDNHGNRGTGSTYDKAKEAYKLAA